MTDLLPIGEMTPRLVTTLQGNPNRVMQSFTRAPWDGTYFEAQVEDEAPLDMRITRCDTSGKVLDFAVLKGAGHGSSITAEYSAGKVWIWLWWNIDATTGGAMTPIRWAYNGTPSGAVVNVADTETLTVPAGVVPGHFAIDQAADRIATYSRSGNNEVLKLWKFSEFRTGTATALKTAAVTKAANASFQGFTTSDTHAYISRGGSAVGDVAPILYEVGWDAGGVTGTKDISGLALGPGGIAPGGHNEAEGVCLWRDQSGAPTLLFGIVTGPAQQRQGRVYSMTAPVDGTATKTVLIDAERVIDGAATDVVASFKYDRLVRYTTGGFTPAGYEDPVKLSEQTTAELKVSDHPDLTDDSYGFVIHATLSWDSPAEPGRRKTATYTAQLSAADPAVVNLSRALVATGAASPGQVVSAQNGVSVVDADTTSGDFVFKLSNETEINAGPVPAAIVTDSGVAAVIGDASTSAALTQRDANRVTVRPFTAPNLSYATDCTAQIQAALNTAGTGRGVVELPPGIYPVKNLVIPDYVTLKGTSGGAARFGRPIVDGRSLNGSTVLARIDDSTTDTIVTLNGVGSGLSDIAIDGKRVTGSPDCSPAVVQIGFETRIFNLRIVDWPGVALDVQKACNTKWGEIQISECGLTTGPAMRIRSLNNTDGTMLGQSYTTNQVDVYNLLIEQPHGAGLDIAYDPSVQSDGSITSSTAEFYAETIRLVNLHIEMDNDTQNPLPGMRIGNVWHLDILNPSFNWGPTPAIYYDQMGMGVPVPVSTQHYQDQANWGHVRVVGGKVTGGVDLWTPARLIEANRGDDLKLAGAFTAERWSDSAGAVRLNAGFGRFFIDPSVSAGNASFPNSIVNDLRTTTRTEISTQAQSAQFQRNVRVNGHLQGPSASTITTAAEQSGHLGGATITMTGCNDVRGTVTFNTGTGTQTLGPIIKVTFAKAFTRAPVVVLNPTSVALAKLGLCLDAPPTTTGFTVSVTTATAAGWNGYSFNYLVIE